MTNTSVVICTYSEARWDFLAAAVESVRGQTVPPLEIIVSVDHNQTLLDRVRSCWSDVVAVENHETRGLSGARNSGIAAARGEIIAFLDDDAVAASDWLEQLQRGYADENVLGVGGTIQPIWIGHQPKWLPREFYWVVGCTYEGVPTTSAPIRNMIGANMSLRREVFRNVGVFRNGIGRIGVFPLGCEETELCIRARQKWPQGVFRYEPGARVDHCVPPSRVILSYFCSRCYSEGLSKALVSRYVGAKDGLATERAYMLRTLPRGVQQGLGDALRRDWIGLVRAGAIVLGLTLTALGFAVGVLARWNPFQKGTSATASTVEAEPVS